MNLQQNNALLMNAANLLKSIQISPVPDPCQKPQVSSTAVTLPIEPHEEVILNGCGFGDQRGELRLEGNAFPSGHVKLEIITWTRKAIHARVPALKGVSNVPNSIMRIVRKDLVFGDPFNMPFKATVDCQLIPPHRVNVVCAEPGACVKAEDLSKKYFDGPKKHFTDASFGAWHNRAQIYTFGADKAMVNLGNGWVLQGMDYGWEDGGPTPGATNVIVGLPGGFQMHATSFTITMPWKSWNKGEAVYGTKLLACGPWGLPF
ncbi:hypothetical protein YTPLAS18_07630 [Nitrospira sp.]|nr:hypothetical protein YTPLAS18_07630 [Nitrospira sp.]